MNLSLIILAAGLGTRFGGNKQLEPLGPSGQCLLEYSLYDAVSAGFGHVIFIVNGNIEQSQLREKALNISPDINVDFVVQKPTTALPKGFLSTSNRQKPWGTAHAVLCAKEKISNSFAVINADDFYGRDAFLIIANSLKEDQNTSECNVLLSYPLGNTLTEHGGVNRGICSIDKRNYLTNIYEEKDIIPFNPEYAIVANSKKKIALNTPVSMTFWGFYASVIPSLQQAFNRFLAEHQHDEQVEFYIPDWINHELKTEKMRLKCLPTDSQWFGVTYASDKKPVREALHSLTEQGLYPTVFNEQSRPS